MLMLFPFGTRAQHIELIRQQPLASYTILLKDGGIFSISGLTIRYMPSFDCPETDVRSVSQESHPFRLVKWDVKRAYFDAVDWKVNNDTLRCLGYVTALKTKKKLLMEYSFDKQAKLVKERIIPCMEDKSPTALLNSDRSVLTFVDYSYELLDKKSRLFSQQVAYELYDDRYNLLAKGVHKLENVYEDDSLSMWRRGYIAQSTAKLLDDGTLVMHIGNQLYKAAPDDNELIRLELNLDYQITSWQLHERPNGNIVLAGGYSEGVDCGIVLIEFDREFTLKTTDYFPAEPEFIKGFYELSYNSHRIPASHREQQMAFRFLRPLLINSTLEEDGTIRMAFVGKAGMSHESNLEARFFRNNLLFAAVKNRNVVYQQAIPYLYKEDFYWSPGNTGCYAYFGKNSTTIVYQDYVQNYDEKRQYKFVPTIEKIPFVNKPLHASVSYDYTSEEIHHRLMEVRPANGIVYKAKASYISPTYTRLPDGTYLMGCYEYGVASLKDVYIGRLVLPE